MNIPEIYWLDEAAGGARELLGAKGDRLAALAKAGFKIPRGFCVGTQALRRHLETNGLRPGGNPERCAAAVTHCRFPPGLEQGIVQAYERLETEVVAVRSSAVAEDLVEASFAGQLDTFLDVRGPAAVLDAIRRCWASFWSERVVAYRRDHPQAEPEPLMAVLVQVMVPCDVSGVAFSVDPVSGEDCVVIEAACGPGGVVSGTADVERHTIDRTRVSGAGIRSTLLTPGQLDRLSSTVLALEDLLGGPQDVEWGFAGDELHVFQSRPITVLPRSFFTDRIPGDGYLWTSGFLNERFPKPVSPLGWTLIRRSLEALAFREPLRFMGHRLPGGFPVTKLYRGHPFVNAQVFCILYKPFPDWLLPEDAARYFPGGDTKLRCAAVYPCCRADPRLLWSLFWNFAKDAGNCSPFHNYRRWEAFVPQFETEIGRLGEPAHLSDAWKIFEQVQALSERLLAIHRWSLTHADLFYSLLRRLLKRWFPAESAGCLAAQLTAGFSNKSVELNEALQAVRGSGDWQSFAEAYGHRSFSLDILQPCFAEEPDQVRTLAGTQNVALDRPGRASAREEAERELRETLAARRWGWIDALVCRSILACARRYMVLREDQRFYWQKALALQRGLALMIGRWFAAEGRLRRADDIFFATIEEVEEAVHGRDLPDREIQQRKAGFRRLVEQCDRDPGLSYPGFLRGNTPLPDHAIEPADLLQGVPVSPGIARGPARLITSPGQFERIRTGDILVTRAADPGWTPIFGRLAGLVLELGGQLSHGAVVAREYGLPAVAGVANATRQIRDGQEVLVDGAAGTVGILEEG